jgi:hypothetical protein
MHLALTHNFPRQASTVLGTRWNEGRLRASTELHVCTRSVLMLCLMELCCLGDRSSKI